MSTTAVMSTPAQLLKTWYEEVWNKANEQHIDEFLHKDVVVYGLDPAGVTVGIDAFKSFYKNFRASFPNIHVDLEILVSDDKFVTGYAKVTAKNTEGKEVVFNGLTVAKFVDQKATDTWNNFDFLKMYQQLGHILQAQL